MRKIKKKGEPTDFLRDENEREKRKNRNVSVSFQEMIDQFHFSEPSFQ
ncbi:hypothetical protein LEP1GSC163_1147 [Leptospira santarosai str. CBC379]|uniref:Uncharacterized protein n=1 Tax=Leptospira santarosai str. MOR084 TaxID=1049984 RepID=A0A0E2BL13_9LEPT|nr:hypothetical protein LEP1GSC179_0250 [Leptospira santarosai str. MOR084]EKR93222.1 hypothetical protein LEP1GSC163_1147 [Leptospira santarosai str. CBC379]